jgi:two-component system OmpR family response regulator
VLSYSGVKRSPAAALPASPETEAVTPINFTATAPVGLFPETAYDAVLKAYIVEDNAVIRDNLMETLTELAGVQTVGYSETEQGACFWLAQHPRDWQLLVVDLFLQQGSGLGVLRKCGQRNSRQRVVVLSNYATADIRERCLACGADAVFDKSTELDQFLAYCSRQH